MSIGQLLGSTNVDGEHHTTAWMSARHRSRSGTKVKWELNAFHLDARQWQWESEEGSRQRG